MTLALATAGLLFLVGLHAVTWIFLAITMILTITEPCALSRPQSAEPNEVRHYEYTVQITISLHWKFRS